MATSSYFAQTRPHRAIAAIVVALLIPTPPVTAEESKYQSSHAVVVGISDYASDGWPDLKYATRDAEGVAQFLVKTGFAVITLYDQEATKTAILSTLQTKLARQLSSDDRVLIFFAGHGHTEQLAEEDFGYLVPHDGTDDSATYISMEEIQTLSRKLGRAKHQLFVINACYGGLLGTRGVGRVDPTVPNYLDEVTRRPSRQFITAGGKDQQVLDGGPGGYSFFTYYFLQALDEGLGDTNKDGYVTFSELTAFLVPSATNPYQTPTSGSMPGHQLGEFVFHFPEGERSSKASGSGGHSESKKSIAVVNAPKNASVARRDKDVDPLGIVSIKATEEGLDTPQSPRVFKQRFIANNIGTVDSKRGGEAAGTVVEIVGITSNCSPLAALRAYACMVQLSVDAVSKQTNEVLVALTAEASSGPRRDKNAALKAAYENAADKLAGEFTKRLLDYRRR